MANTTKKKFGGRQKGTPNILGTDLRRGILATIEEFILDGEFTENFKELSPAEKINAVTKLLNIVLPKMQAISIEQQTERKLTIEDRLLALSIEEVEEAEEE